MGRSFRDLNHIVPHGNSLISRNAIRSDELGMDAIQYNLYDISSKMPVLPNRHNRINPFNVSGKLLSVSSFRSHKRFNVLRQNDDNR